MTFRKTSKTVIAALVLATSGLALTACNQAPAEVNNYANDRAEIEDLMSRYLFAMDYNDFDSYVETFTEDGSLEYASGSATGREAIKETVSAFKKAIGEFYTTEDGNPAALRHVLLQMVVRVEGDKAWTRSMWMEMANDGPDDSLKMGTFGIYEDELERVDGHWLFSKRVILNEFLEGRNSGPGNPVLDMDELADTYLGQSADHGEE